MRLPQRFGGQLAGWNGESLYIRVRIDPTAMDYAAPIGHAIGEWNRALGSRFFITPDQGDVELTFYGDQDGSQYTGRDWSGLYKGFDAYGFNVTGTSYPVHQASIWMRLDHVLPFWTAANIAAHELGHLFDLRDHPSEDFNSIMSYQRDGRLLYGPSRADLEAIRQNYGLDSLQVPIGALRGSEALSMAWHFDRNGRVSGRRAGEPRWRSWVRGLAGGGVRFVYPGELYWCCADRPTTLSFGRWSQDIPAGESRFMYV